jgi:hypothetical protein
MAGAKAAVLATVATAVPTVRIILFFVYFSSNM